MSYIKDPREMAIRPESGVTLEQDNRYEEMYHYGTMVLDLCDLPVSEYMKPMTVNVEGSVPSTPLTAETKDGIYQWGSMILDLCDLPVSEYMKPITINAEGSIPSATETNENVNILASVINPNGDGKWKIRWEWTGSFDGTISVSAKVKIGEKESVVGATFSDNAEKKYEAEITDIAGDESVTSLESVGVGESTDYSTLTEIRYEDKRGTTNYTFTISKDAAILNLSFIAILSGVTVIERNDMKFNDVIPTCETDKEGYIFDGWFLKDGTKFEETKMPAKDITVYGKYSIKKYTVTFVIDGVEKKKLSVDYGSVISSSSVPAITNKTGYSGEWDGDVREAITADTVFTAVYTAIDYTLTWDFSGDTLMEVLHYGDAIDYENAKTVLGKEGYTITGWSYTAATMPNKNLTITAKYSANKHNVFYKVTKDGATVVVASETAVYGSIIKKAALPKYEGYTASEWDGYVEGMTMPDNDVTFTAICTKNVYTVTYYVDGTILDVTQYLYGETVTPKAKYEKEGYTVSDWVGEPVGAMPAMNVSATCKTAINQYLVTFKDEEGSTVHAERYDYGTTIADIDFTIVGYTFTLDKETPETVPSSDIVVNITKVPNEHILTIKNGDDSVELVVKYGENLTDILNKYEKFGYVMTFTPNVTVMGDDDITVTISHTPITLSVSVDGVAKEINFDANILDSIGAINVEEGKKLDSVVLVYNGEETVISKGDVLDEAIYEKIQQGAVIESRTSDIIVPVIVTVEGINDPIKDDLAYGANISQYINGLGITAEEGHTAVWTVDGEPLTSDMTVGDVLGINIECTFTLNSHVLSFYNGTVLISSAITNYGATIEYPEMPNEERNGVTYVFKWADTSKKGQPMPDSNLTINGQYEEKVVAPQVVYYGIADASTPIDVTLLESFDADMCINKPKSVTTVIPASEEFAEIEYRYNEEGEIDFDEYKALIEQFNIDNSKSYYFVVPKSAVDGATVRIYSVIMTELTPLVTTVMVGDEEYVSYELVGGANYTYNSTEEERNITMNIQIIK